MIKATGTKKIFNALKLWELLFLAALLFYIADILLYFGLFYITVPLTFFLGVVCTVFAIYEKSYQHAILTIICLSLPLCKFMVKL